MRISRSLIERVLVRHANNDSPEVRLVAAIIAQAIDDADVDFLRSADCKHYADLIGVELRFVKDLGATGIVHNMVEDPKVLIGWFTRTLSCSVTTVSKLEESLAA